MRRKATMVSFNFYHASPLPAGCLHAYALKNEEIARQWTFDYYTRLTAEANDAQTIRDLANADSDLYCFSCYAWNMGLIRRVLAGLVKARPDAHILLGGPQVMNYASTYLDPSHERMALCNGEGERTFQNYLLQLLSERTDLSQVKGLSFYRDRDLITTPAEERIRDLDEIPSPYLQGLVDPTQWTMILMETNRGCPYACTYCYWGGAVGAKVNKMGEARLREEIEFLARKGINTLYIVDANWGMTQRDVELTRFVVECKAKHGAPLGLSFSTAKNSQDRVTEIVRLAYDAKMAVSQVISLQTTSSTVLEKVGRKNIKKDSYVSIQKTLNELELPSQVELIWPLPGETLQSFRQGVRELWQGGASSLIVYELLLINNVEMLKKRDEYQLVTERYHDRNAEIEVVVSTKEVTQAEALAGRWFAIVVFAFYNLRALAALPAYLDRSGYVTFDQFFWQLAEFLRNAAAVDPFAKLIEAYVVEVDHDYARGNIIHGLLHARRAETTRLLLEFFATQPWWQDETAQYLFEIDQLNLPYVYSNSVMQPEALALKHVQLLSVTADGYLVQVKEGSVPLLHEMMRCNMKFRSHRLFVNHRSGQYTPLAGETPTIDEILYCGVLSFLPGALYPSWTDADASREGTDPRHTPPRRQLPVLSA